MATARGSSQCCFLVIGQPNSDIAKIVNGLVGVQMLRSSETSNRSEVVHEQVVSGIAIKVCTLLGIEFLGTGRRGIPYEILSKCPKEEVGILIYCITTDGLGFDLEGKKNEIENITNAYGEDIWQRSVIVFLKADKCAARFINAANTTQSFNRQLDNWKDQVLGIMRASAVKQKMCFAPAGKENVLALPGREFWLSSLWKMVQSRSTKAFKAGFIQLSKKRLQKDKEMRANIQEIRQRRIYDQPICTSALPMGPLKLAVAVGGPAAVASGTAGATIGAVIGALAIGIPTFGVAALAGLTIGAVVGGGIGVGIGAGVGGAAAGYRARNDRQQHEIFVQQSVDDENEEPEEEENEVARNKDK